MEFRDYYKTLGVERDATQSQIKSAFRKLARKHHPDVNPNDKKAEQKFKEVNEAYQVLSDPEKRKKYDRLGADWERGEAEEELRKRYAAAGGFGGGPSRGTAEGADFSDFFSSFFGSGSGFEGFERAGRGGGGFNFTRQPQKAPDVQAEVPISLEEAVSGARKRIALTALDECEQCQGQGVIFQEETKGNTRVVRAAQNCPRCGGSGVIETRRTLEITIPPGSEDGTRLRLAGQGGKGPKPNLNGDLYVTLRIQPHRVFTPQGRDLKCVLPVWDYEAVLGAEVTAPTVGSRLMLKIPAGSQTGRVMRLRGKGLPARGNKPAGDLLYELRVLAPTDVNDEERKLLAEIAESRRARGVPDPRADLLRS